MEVSSKPLRINDIKKEIIRNNKDLDEKAAELIAMLTMDLIDEFGEKYSNEIINKIINTMYIVASKNAGKKEKRMETVVDVLRKENLGEWTILRNGENNPTFAAYPVMNLGNVVDTKRYIVIPANFNPDHYDYVFGEHFHSSDPRRLQTTGFPFSSARTRFSSSQYRVLSVYSPLS